MKLERHFLTSTLIFEPFHVIPHSFGTYLCAENVVPPIPPSVHILKNIFLCHRPDSDWCHGLKLWRSTDADIQGYIIRIDRCHQLQERPKKMHWRHGLRGMKLKGKRCHRCHQSPAGFWSGYILLRELRFWGVFHCFARFEAFGTYFWGFWAISYSQHVFLRLFSRFDTWFWAISWCRHLVLSHFLRFTSWIVLDRAVDT